MDLNALLKAVVDCGATDLEWLSGEELKVIELEVI